MIVYLLSPPEDPFLDQLPELFQQGVDWFQYRRPHESDRDRVEELKQVVSLGRRHDVRIIVNDRPDLALAVEADGVHLGEDDLPPGEVKAQWPSLVVGATQRVEDPLVQGVDYYGVGPVFEPRSKSLETEACGWDGVEKVASRTEKPVIAIGGISVERLKELPPSTDGIAVISAVWEKEKPSKALEALRSKLSG